MGDKPRRTLVLAVLLASACEAQPAATADAGPQGGYHVFLSVRVTGLDPGDPSRPPGACASMEPNDNPCIEFVVRDLAGPAEPLDFYVALHLPLVPGPAGSFQLDGPRLVQLDIGGLPDIEGHTLEIRTEVTDHLGRHAEATLAATAVGVPLNGP